MLVFPAFILFTSLGTWDMFWKMHLPSGDCWENSKHEKVCKDNNTCKFGRNFCIPEVYRWRVDATQN